MCDATYALYAAVALSATSAYTSAQNQKASAGYQASVARNNVSIADQQAADAKARGDKAAAEVRRKYAALVGTQRASLAARGLDISDGSANAILTDTDYFGAYDQEVARANAAREAWGYKVRASNSAGDAAALQAQADAANPLLSATLAGGQAYVSSKWYNFGKS